MNIDDIVKALQSKKNSKRSIFQGIFLIIIAFLMAKYAGTLKPSEKEFVNTQIMPVVFYFFGLFSFAAFIFNGYKQLIVKQWIQTKCTILDKKLYKEERGGVAASSFVSLTYTLPIVLFKYKYNDKYYTCYKIFNGITLSLLNKYSEDLYGLYEKAKSYTCYVNPNKPEEAVLSNDIYLNYISLYAVFGSIFMMLGYYI